MKTSTLTRLAAFTVALGLAAGPASAAAIHGALFTTNEAGDVNVNIYDIKEDVYLNGGPKNDNCAAAGIDDGTYVYQVTNPNGDVVLSSDGVGRSPIGVREFTVTGGVITAVDDDHHTVPGDCGSTRLQLFPFDDTPNNGGEYKAWITRKDDYIANNGFKPGSTKTDNFKVKVLTPPTTGGLLIYKFYDANGNGVRDDGDVPLFDWAMTVSGVGTQLTLSPDGLVTFPDLSLDGNPYAVTEGTAGPRWVQSASLINGAPSAANPEKTVSVTVVAGENTQVDFGNYCTCTIKPYPTNYWLGSTGQTKLGDGTGMNPEFKLLNNANLRKATGGQFNMNLTTMTESENYALLNSWLMGAGSSGNEAYKLSAQLAVLKLNVEAGFARKKWYVKGAGSIEQIIADANVLLSNAICGTTCNTLAGTQPGDDQAALRAIIEDINDGITVIMPTPCAYKFTIPTNTN